MNRRAGEGSYERAGVGPQEGALSAVARSLGPTFSFPDGAEVLTDFGHYAAAVKVADDLAIAICTDGVGTKTIVASKLGRYDTIGFDCVAMNVNDLICIGARPLAMVDYLGVHTLDPQRVEGILEGLGAAAKEASIAIPGGELAQLPEVIGSDGGGGGDPTAFDLVGTCIGTLRPDDLILGHRVARGDAVIGVGASGIHSNGFTLARRALMGSGRYRLEDNVDALGRTLGEELLEPTEIYVRAITALWRADVDTRGLAHITGDGLLNLTRVGRRVGFTIDHLMPEPAIFEVIRDAGGIEDAEMFTVFNMGIGFVVVVPESDVDACVNTLRDGGYYSQRIGVVNDQDGVVRIEQRGLVGSRASGRFSAS